MSGQMPSYQQPNTQFRNNMEGIITENDRSRFEDIEYRSTSKAIATGFKVKSDRDLENQARAVLISLKAFVSYAENKHNRWKTDIDTVTTEKVNQLRMKYDAFKALTSQRGMDAEKLEEQIVYVTKSLIRAYLNKSNLNYLTMKDFFVKHERKGMRKLLKYLDERSALKDPSYLQKSTLQSNPDAVAFANSEVKAYNEIEEEFNTLMSQLKTSNNAITSKLETISTNIVGMYATIQDEKKSDIDDHLEKAYVTIRSHDMKINSFYELRYSLLEMLLDTQFFLIYVLKALRVLFTYISLFLATRMFVPIYENIVYDEKKDPPPLWKYLLIFVGFDFSLNVFLIVLLFLVKYLFKNEDNSFLIDGAMITNHMCDYASSMVITFFLGVLIGSVIIKKKYFKYKYEGMRAIRAFEKMTFYVAMVNTLVPFFLIF